MTPRAVSSLLLILLFSFKCEAFVGNNNNKNDVRPFVVTTELKFGIPDFLTPDTTNDDNKDDKKKTKPEKEIGWKGVVQLVTAGMGAPFLGDYEGVDEETGKMMFSLEANNLVDEEGNSKQTQMPFFESGWVDPEEEERARKRREEGFKFPWQR